MFIWKRTTQQFNEQHLMQKMFISKDDSKIISINVLIVNFWLFTQIVRSMSLLSDT